MIIVLKPESTQQQIDALMARIKELGLRAHLSQGEQRTIVGVIGEEEKLQVQPLQAMPGVEQVIPILKPFKLASRQMHPADTIVSVKAGANGPVVKFGGGNVAMIAGPCAIEGEEVLLEIAKSVKAAGAIILRGGAFKPRTSPYWFQGLGEAGLKMLRDSADQYGLKLVSEVMDVSQIELIGQYVDILQLGARNMQNFNLLRRIGAVRTPVLLKRGIAATMEELLLSAEYIMAGGNYDVILCERGIRTYETATRNTMDISAIPVAKKLSHLPIVGDPSHGTGRRDMVLPMARAAVAAGADGIIVEVHPNPDKAWSDGAQTITPKQLAELMPQIRKIAEAVGRTA